MIGKYLLITLVSFCGSSLEDALGSCNDNTTNNKSIIRNNSNTIGIGNNNSVDSEGRAAPIVFVFQRFKPEPPAYPRTLTSVSNVVCASVSCCPF